jgi:monovalent cation:H+ antiporter, CPA1 family
LSGAPGKAWRWRSSIFPFIVADRVHVSGVVAVLAAGMTVSASGRTRITPYNWSFLADLWEQLAFWVNSLIFLLAAILVPKLLIDLRLRDLALMCVSSPIGKQGARP